MPQPNSPRVVLIHNFLPPHRVPLFEELATRFDLDVWILGAIKSVREWEEPDTSNTVRIRSLPRMTMGLGSRYNALLLSYTLPKELREARPDVLICCGWDTPAAFYAARWARCTGTPFIVWSGSTAAEDTRLRRMTRPLVRWYVQSAQAWLAYGARSKEYLIELGANADRVYCAHNTVDVAYYAIKRQTAEESAQELRQRWGLGESRVVLFVGNLLKLKGVRELIEAFARFHETLADTKLLLVGEGEERTALEQQIVEHGLSGQVVLTGFLDRETIATCYALADLLVLPSRSEVWGLVINEALASGVPVLATDVCGATADLIEDGVNGYVVQSDNAEALANTMTRHFAAPETHQQLRNAARKSVEQFTFAAAAHAFGQSVDAARGKH
jgi:glycosyltransferase involved in cell wall biosynthesis